MVANRRQKLAEESKVASLSEKCRKKEKKILDNESWLRIDNIWNNIV